MASRPPSATFWRPGGRHNGEKLQTFATITTDSNKLLTPIQARMPVIFEWADWPVWLGEAEGDPVALLRAAPGDALRFWRVGKQVG
jgi:putative SOS response-associated peptidase YedK